ncbi:MAG TPA: thioesterase family protein [Pseudobdellovibrionaceae bacterium]|nr:thioesterase family protein [Pseudobdellovibrionaceae bacterium]
MLWLARRVHFSNTDAMGVMHHSQHVHVFEEARVEWMRRNELMDLHIPRGPLVFGVLRLDVRYHRPLKFDDLAFVACEGRLQGALIQFRYAMFAQASRELVVTGETDLTAMQVTDLRPARLPLAVREKLRAQTWSSTWPPNPPSEAELATLCASTSPQA